MRSQVSDPQQMHDADKLLRTLLREFRQTWGAQLEAAQVEAAGEGARDAAARVNALAPSDLRRFETIPPPSLGEHGGAAGASGAEGGGGEGGTLEQAAMVAEAVSRSTEAASRAATAAAAAVVAPLARALHSSLGHPFGEPDPADLASGTRDGGGGDLTERELEGSMAAMSALFAQQMASPAYNMVQGPLLQLLLIQTQYMKREMLRQMNAMDTLLRENFFTASMSALLPGAIALGSACVVLRRLSQKLLFSRRRSRRSLVKQVRSVLRDAERLLIRSLSQQKRVLGLGGVPTIDRGAGAHVSDGRRGGGAHAADAYAPGGGRSPPCGAASDAAGVADAATALMPSPPPPAARLGDVDTGLLVISLHVLRQTLERSKGLLSVGERSSLFEDLEDLESDLYDCESKLLVLQRIYRTQPALLAGGGAASAGSQPREFAARIHLGRR